MSHSVSPLTRDQCETRLSGRSVARVSVSVNALPVVVPVVYLVDDGAVLFRAPFDDALAAACDGSVIAFEVDDLSASPAAAGSWSVQIVGVGSLLNEREQLRALKLGSLDVNGAGLDHVVRLQTARLSGQQLHTIPSSSATCVHSDPSREVTGRGLRGLGSPRLARSLHGTPLPPTSGASTEALASHEEIDND